MEGTGDFHHQITNGATPEPEGILDHATAFDAAIDVFNPHPPPGQRLIVGFLFGREAATTRLLRRLEHLDTIECKGEKAQVLQQLAIGRQRIGRVIRDALIVHAPLKGRTQKQDAQAGIDQQQVLQGVALFLAAIVEALFSRVRGARDGALGAVVTKRGSLVRVRRDFLRWLRLQSGKGSS